MILVRFSIGRGGGGGRYRKYIEDNIVHSGHPKTAVTHQDRSPMRWSTQVKSGQTRGTLVYLHDLFTKDLSFYSYMQMIFRLELNK